jgi:hypothetical protein
MPDLDADRLADLLHELALGIRPCEQGPCRYRSVHVRDAGYLIAAGVVLVQPAAPAEGLHWDLALGSRAEQEGTPQPPSVEALADALPQHRTCSDDISGHESCLRIARAQWANLRRGS